MKNIQKEKLKGRSQFYILYIEAIKKASEEAFSLLGVYYGFRVVLRIERVLADCRQDDGDNGH